MCQPTVRKKAHNEHNLFGLNTEDVSNRLTTRSDVVLVRDTVPVDELSDHVVMVAAG